MEFWERVPPHGNPGGNSSSIPPHHPCPCPYLFQSRALVSDTVTDVKCGVTFVGTRARLCHYHLKEPGSEWCDVHQKYPPSIEPYFEGQQHLFPYQHIVNSYIQSTALNTVMPTQAQKDRFAVLTRILIEEHDRALAANIAIPEGPWGQAFFDGLPIED